jgi:hypothetical protein
MKGGPSIFVQTLQSVTENVVERGHTQWMPIGHRRLYALVWETRAERMAARFEELTSATEKLTCR